MLLSSVPKCKKSVMGLIEKIYLLNKLCAGNDLYSVVGCEHNASESTIHVKLSLKRKTQKIKIYIDQLEKKNSQRLA